MERRGIFGAGVKLDPNFATAWALLAKTHAGLFWTEDATDTRRAAARTALDTTLRLHPEQVEALLAQGYYQYWVERDYAGARRRFELVHAKWPNNAEILLALGLIARRQVRWDQSKAYLNQAVALDPLSIEVRVEVVELYVRSRDFMAAHRLVNDALKIWPNDPWLILRKVIVSQSLGQLDQADELLKGVHPRPDDATVLAIVNMARFRRRYGEAISTLEALLAVDRAAGSAGLTSSYLNLYLGNLRRLSRDVAGAKVNYILARNEFVAELKRQPDNPIIVINLAWAYCGLGDREAAVKYAEQAVTLRPLSKDALDGANYEDGRVRIWARFGDRDKAIPAIVRLLKLPADWPLTPALLRLDPDFDKLRGDPRFEALLIEDGKP